MKIGIASDHAGYELKSEIIQHFPDIEFVDCGTDNAEKSVDYPDIAKILCQNLIAGKFNQAILICGSGVGVSITANRFKEIRAALCFDSKVAELARKHNDANVLCLGARITQKKDIIEIIETFLNTEFEGGRHQARIDKLNFQC
jgi:ribose 5-phosphate isomerase B